MTSHPVLAHCDVFQHFLTCGADEKAWKQGKRKAERDELVGANFFLTIRLESEFIVAEVVSLNPELECFYYKLMS